jgi:hypothetical protein
MGWNGEDGWNPSGVVIVMLESAKGQIIGVDTLGQQVTPCVRYGTIFLLIRDVVGSVSCSDEWELA